MKIVSYRLDCFFLRLSGLSPNSVRVAGVPLFVVHGYSCFALGWWACVFVCVCVCVSLRLCMQCWSAHSTCVVPLLGVENKNTTSQEFRVSCQKQAKEGG